MSKTKTKTNTKTENPRSGDDNATVTKSQFDETGAAPVLVRVPRWLVHLGRVAGTERVRPNLCGVHVRRDVDWMVYEATDGVAFLSIDVPMTAEEQQAAPVPPTTIKTGDWCAGLEHMTADKDDKLIHPDSVLLIGVEKVEIINASSETTAEIAAVPVSGKFPDAALLVPKYELREDMSGDADAQRKLAGRALVDAERLAELLKTMAKMASSDVVIEVPLSPMEPVVLRAAGHGEDSRMTGVLYPAPK